MRSEVSEAGQTRRCQQAEEEELPEEPSLAARAKVRQAGLAGASRHASLSR
jgi:hypothetical protein